uniref:C2H2-type domain-containing protein n=1 Tax=Periophthalmus magnuspinnatus TaxID=409849 RepID=A0A3B3ZVS8_9GOBI
GPTSAFLLCCDCPIRRSILRGSSGLTVPESSPSASEMPEPGLTQVFPSTGPQTSGEQPHMFCRLSSNQSAALFPVPCLISDQSRTPYTPEDSPRPVPSPGPVQTQDWDWTRTQERDWIQDWNWTQDWAQSQDRGHPEPRYDCLHCEQSFTGSTTLMSLNVHTSVPHTHTCTRHLDHHIQVESLSVLCSVLGSTLLRIHQRTHVPRPFVCDVCGRSYASEVALTAHTKLHGEKRFLCHTCGRGFVSRVALRSHVRTHTGERPYTCTLCGRGFAFNAGLKVHLRRHLGDKPYTCSVCGKGFPSGGDLSHRLGQRSCTQVSLDVSRTLVRSHAHR